MSRALRFLRRCGNNQTLLVVTGALLIETIGRWLLTFTLGLGVRPTGVVVAFGAVILGAASAPGVFSGVLLAGLVTNGTVVSVVNAVAVTAGVVLGGRAAAEFGPDRLAGLSAWLRLYLFIVLSATCISAATSGVLADLLGLAPFQLVVERFLTTNLPLAYAVSPILWYVPTWNGTNEGPRDPTDGEKQSEGKVRGSLGSRLRVVLFGIASVGWVLVGYTVGFVFRATEQVPAERIGDRLIPAAGQFLELVGPRGVAVQVLLGIVALLLVLISVGQLSFERYRR